MIILWLSVVGCFLCVIYVFLITSKRRKYPQPPSYSGWVPLIGHAYLFLGDSLRIWRSLQEIGQECLRRGGVITVSLGLNPFYVVTDPNDFATVANTCLEKDHRYKLFKPWLGDGLITGSLDVWKRHRKLLNPAFNPILLEGFLKVFNSQVRLLVTELASKKNTDGFDHFPYFEKLTLETVCLTAIGIPEENINQWKTHYVQTADQLAKIQMYKVVKIWLQIPFLFYLSGMKKQEDKLIETVHGLMDLIIKTKRSKMNESNSVSETTGSGSKFKAFLDLMLEDAQKPDGFSDREIREEVDSIILGGYQSLASTITIMLVLIGSYKDIQTKIYQELKEVYGDSDRDVNKSDMAKLVYLEAVIKETLRLHTVTPIMSRYLHKDVKLKNYTLPAGSNCALMIYGLHHHPQWGVDVNDYKPERWLSKTKDFDVNKLFVPFSFGRRDCIGKTYAMMLIKTTLVHVLRRYRIDADHNQLKLKINIILRTDSGHFISIHDRENRKEI